MLGRFGQDVGLARLVRKGFWWPDAVQTDTSAVTTDTKSTTDCPVCPTQQCWPWWWLVVVAGLTYFVTKDDSK